MFCSNGTRLIAKSAGSESVAAREFFRALWSWSSAGSCRGLKIGSRRRIHTVLQRPARGPIRSRHLALQKPTCGSFCTKTTKVSPIIEGRAEGHTTSLDRQLIPETLRHLMRSLSSTVVVLTTSAPRPEVPSAATTSPKPYYRGMTLSSFTTLSLTPPLITFNIRAPSRTLSAIEQSGAFFIHVLHATQEGATIADSFTRGNAEGVVVGEAFQARHGSFESHNVSWELDKNGGALNKPGLDLPKLAGKGVKKVLACELYKPSALDTGVTNGLVKVGEHVLVIAKVAAIYAEGGSTDDAVEEGYGLSYVDGRYRMVGGSIMRHDVGNDLEKEGDGVV